MLIPSSTGKPRVVLGVMTFGPDVEAGARVTNIDDYKKVLDHFQSQGYNEIDTARLYDGGKQEAFTREANWEDRGLTLATKCYPVEPGQHGAELLIASLDKSLEELGTKCVDIFYLHAPDRSIPFAETLEALDKAHKQGKFVQLGLSNYTSFEVAEIVMTCKYNGWVRPTIYQGVYNVLNRNIEAELIPACRRYGLDVVVYSPVAGGIFSGKYKSSGVVPTEGRFSDNAKQLAAYYRNAYFKDSTWEALRIIEPVAEKHNLTLIEAAVRWIIHHSALNFKDGGRDGIIMGASSLQQLESNLKDCEKGPLPDEVVKALNEVWSVTKSEAPVYWHHDLKYGYDTQKVLFQ